jgi:hypothetical protein
VLGEVLAADLGQRRFVNGRRPTTFRFALGFTLGELTLLLILNARDGGLLLLLDQLVLGLQVNGVIEQRLDPVPRLLRPGLDVLPGSGKKLVKSVQSLEKKAVVSIQPTSRPCQTICATASRPCQAS